MAHPRAVCDPRLGGMPTALGGHGLDSSACPPRAVGMPPMPSGAKSGSALLVILGLGDADDADADASASVARGVTRQVVGLLMDDNRTADDRVRAAKADHVILNMKGRLAAG